MRLLLLAVLLSAAPASADSAACAPGGAVVVSTFNGADDDLARLGELAGAVAPRPGVIRRGAPHLRDTCASGPALPWALPAAPAGDRFLLAVPPRLATVVNTGYPHGGNDGLVWAGRGASTLVTGGVAFRLGVLSGAIVPEVAWQQNAWLETPQRAGAPAWTNPWYGANIDLPLRQGAGPFSSAALGQSVLRVDWKGAAVGISTENQWWGPGLRDAILLTDNAPGFPHVFLGTSRPVDVWVGHVEATAFWGRLDRTEDFAGGGHPLAIGLALDYAPSFIPNLTLGLGRVFLQPWDGLEARDYFPFLQSFWKKDLDAWYGDAETNPDDNQLASLWWRWVFPAAGLEIYGEWAREDHEFSQWRFVEEPDHTQAWIAGLQKVFVIRPDRWVRLHVEIADLQEVRPVDAERGMPTWYLHGGDLGYTHRGQVLGASIGPGADSQRLTVDVFGPRGRIGGYVERVRRNEAYYWTTIEPLDDDTAGHDTELTAAVRQVLFAGPVDVSWELGVSHRWNRDFGGDDVNVHGRLELAVPLARTR